MPLRINIIALCISFLLTPHSFAETGRGLSGFFNDLTSSEGYIQRKKQQEWFQANKGKLQIRKASESLFCKTQNIGFTNQCRFIAELENNSKDEVTSLIIRIKIYNNKGSSFVTNAEVPAFDYYTAAPNSVVPVQEPTPLVAQEMHKFNISIYPTVKKRIDVNFTTNLHEAIGQVGDSWSWNYEVIGYLPKGLDYSHSTFSKITGDEFDWLNK